DRCRVTICAHTKYDCRSVKTSCADRDKISVPFFNDMSSKPTISSREHWSHSPSLGLWRSIRPIMASEPLASFIHTSCIVLFTTPNKIGSAEDFVSALRGVYHDNSCVVVGFPAHEEH